MSDRPDKVGYGTWSDTGVGTTAGVTVTRAGVANRSHQVVGIQASGDAAAIVTVESPANTILYRKRFAAAFNITERFVTPLRGATGQAVLVKVSASTANSEANMQGYTVGA